MPEKYERLLESIGKGNTSEILNRVTCLLKDLGIYLIEKPMFFIATINKHVGDQSIRINLYYPNYYFVYKITPDDHESVTLVQLGNTQENYKLYE